MLCTENFLLSVPNSLSISSSPFPPVRCLIIALILFDFAEVFANWNSGKKHLLASRVERGEKEKWENSRCKDKSELSI